MQGLLQRVLLQLLCSKVHKGEEVALPEKARAPLLAHGRECISLFARDRSEIKAGSFCCVLLLLGTDSPATVSQSLPREQTLACNGESNCAPNLKHN